MCHSFRVTLQKEKQEKECKKEVGKGDNKGKLEKKVREKSKLMSFIRIFKYQSGLSKLKYNGLMEDF